MRQHKSYVLGISESKGRTLLNWICSKDCKNLVSFWLLGVGIDFGYWAILTAAHDLISQGDDVKRNVANATMRQCNHLSSGVILVTNVIPNLLMKIIFPFFPLWVHTRTFIIIVTSVAGFTLAAYKQSKAFILTGVALSSISVGIGESTFLMYIPYYKDKKIVSAWSSGTGASGFLASLTYLSLIDNGVSLSITLYVMITAPLVMALVFWLFLDHPKIEKDTPGIPSSFPKEEGPDDNNLNHVTTEDKTTLSEKMKILCRLLSSYSIPFFLVFLLQCIINQGFFELITFRDNSVELASHVRWFNFVYLVSVLISRSSGLLKINYLWLMVLLQGINLVLFITESIYGWMGAHSFWIVIAIIVWEGLISGCSYVNTYRKMNAEVPVKDRQFAMSINSVGASLGMLFAGLIAMPLHNYICDLPIPP